MTQEQWIEQAALIARDLHDRRIPKGYPTYIWELLEEIVPALYPLVQQAVATEMERCAKAAEKQAEHAKRLALEDMTDTRVTVLMASERIAAAIRKAPE